MNNHPVIYLRSPTHFNMSAIGLEAPIFNSNQIWAWFGLASEIGTDELGGIISYITRLSSNIGKNGNILSNIGSDNIIGVIG